MVAFVTLKCPELAPIISILEQLNQTGSEYTGVHLKGLDRSDSDANNAEVLDYLGEHGRRFGELFSDELDEISKIAAYEYDERIQKALNLAKKAAAKSARALGKELGLSGKSLRDVARQSASAVEGFDRTERWSRETAAAVLRSCMKKYMDIVAQHIAEQKAPGGVRDFSGGPDAPYPVSKQKDVGFKYPIGKRTAQLLENLDHTNAAARMTLERK